MRSAPVRGIREEAGQGKRETHGPDEAVRFFMRGAHRGRACASVRDDRPQDQGTRHGLCPAHVHLYESRYGAIQQRLEDGRIVAAWRHVKPHVECRFGRTFGAVVHHPGSVRHL